MDNTYDRPGAPQGATATLEHEYEQPAPEHPSVAQLFSDLTAEVSTLVREEVELARTEMVQKYSAAARDVVYMAVGGAIAYAGFLVLLAAASFGLFILFNHWVQWYHAAWISTLIVGVVVAVVGYAFVQSGKTALKNTKLYPQETAETMRENRAWLKRQIRK